MITSGFPFGLGETYIESEIDFLKDRFDKVIILPVELDPGAVPTRTVPQGVEYINVSERKQKIARAGDTVGGLKNLVFPTEYYKYDKKPPNTCMKCKNFMGNSAFLPEMTVQHQKAA